METQVTITKNKQRNIRLFVSKVLIKWASNYITAMSKALYPPETKAAKSKNDRHRMFHK